MFFEYVYPPESFAFACTLLAFIVMVAGLSIRGNMDKWLADVKAASYLLEKDAVDTAALSRAAFGREVMSRFIRDLHVYSRTAGWLLFGGLQRSESINPFRSGAEECKYYSKDANCPFKTREVPCDCAWNDNVRNWSFACNT